MDATPGTLVIIGATVAASIYGWSHPQFIERYLLNTARVRHAGEKYRLLTSGFLHADVLHLAFNMYALYSFGEAIELGRGLPSLLAIYFGSILGGSLLGTFVHRGHEYRALGASGGVCGVVFGTLLLYPGASVGMLMVPIPIPGLVFAPLYLLVSMVGMRKRLGNVGHEAHIGGAVTGLLVTGALHPRALHQGPGVYLWIVGLVALSLVLAYATDFERLWRTRLGWRGSRSWWRRSAARVAASRVAAEEKDLDRLLEKIGRDGQGSLTAAERKRLESISRRRAGAGGTRSR